jgi:hypothetical protein
MAQLGLAWPAGKRGLSTVFATRSTPASDTRLRDDGGEGHSKINPFCIRERQHESADELWIEI